VNNVDTYDVVVTIEVRGKEVVKNTREYLRTDLKTVLLLEEKLASIDLGLLDEQKKKLGI